MVSNIPLPSMDDSETGIGSLFVLVGGGEDGGDDEKIRDSARAGSGMSRAEGRPVTS